MITRISPQEAQQKMTDEGYVYLDVRSVAEFDAGHPAGAYNVPLMDPATGPNEAFVDEVKKALGDDPKVIVGCQAGGRSMRAAQALVAAGFTQLLEQRAGYGGARDPFGQVAEKGWQAAGLPTSQQAEAGRSYAELMKG